MLTQATCTMYRRRRYSVLLHGQPSEWIRKERITERVRIMDRCINKINGDFMKRKIIVAIAILLSTISHSQELKLEVNPDKVLGNITPLLYGAGMEDVNHEIYGGIYSQRIFGESFEEGVLPNALDKFRVYDGVVRMEGDALQIYSEPVVKVISSENVFSEGWAEVDLRFDGFGGFNAGLLMNVTEVSNGKDAYCGYEVVLTRKGVELNRCQYGCSPLAKIFKL